MIPNRNGENTGPVQDMTKYSEPEIRVGELMSLTQKQSQNATKINAKNVCKTQTILLFRLATFHPADVSHQPLAFFSGAFP